MTTIGYIHIAGQRPPRYGVYLFDIIGQPVQDRQRCANTIKEAHAIALEDMKKVPFSCATIYEIRKNKALPVRNVNAAGELEKPIKK